jgi:hypothetical protein
MWSLLLKIEISSIVHCCFIISISQNELNFLLQLHDNEKINIYSGFFGEIFLSANLYRLCKLGIFWWKITFKSSSLKPLNQIKANLAGMVLGWSPFNIVSDSPALHSKWLLLLKIEISLVVVTHNFESGPLKDHFNSNFWAKDFDVIFIS